MFDSDNFSLHFGESFKVRIKVAHNGIPKEQLGMEAIFFKRLSENELDLRFHKELQVVDSNEYSTTFAAEIFPQVWGVYEYGFRLYPRHASLPHPQDLCLVKWV